MTVAAARATSVATSSSCSSCPKHNTAPPVTSAAAHDGEPAAKSARAPHARACCCGLPADAHWRSCARRREASSDCTGMWAGSHIGSGREAMVTSSCSAVRGAALSARETCSCCRAAAAAVDGYSAIYAPLLVLSCRIYAHVLVPDASP